jgi:acetylornithine deacetylase
MPTLRIDSDFLARTAAELVQIDSRNPALAPEGPGEAACGARLAEILAGLGLEVSVRELAPGRVNVVGVLKGRGGGGARSLILNGHLDTVGTEGMADPFSGRVTDGRIHGRGSQDMKGSLAAMAAAVKALKDAGAEPAGDLLLTAVADEEHLSLGTEALLREVGADAAVVTEPTNLELVRAHRGFIWYRLKTLGRAAHGSRYNEGIDANMRMGRFLAGLDELERDLRRRAPHPLVGVPSLHAPLVAGGTEISTYAAGCECRIERRTVPGETPEQATGELRAIIDRLAAQDPTFRAELEVTAARPPFEIDQEADIVQSAGRAVAGRLGRPAVHGGAPFWSDAALFAAAGIDAILLGPRGAGLHAAEEHVDLASLTDLAYILAETARDFCGR